MEMNSQPKIWAADLAAVIRAATRATLVRTTVLRFRLPLMIEFNG
jgi:hypothetical protein